ncbi:O-methyltransferase [Priestia megaterium]|uniref:O-methyltransferase n=1 Tax=Priestia megaterium TaxID=1404 RepID=UPI001A948E03|nr:O-methyltransferase [Priestia megaterium]QSX24192.1 O-methyltransferase [Priestia megaterium]
MEELKLPAVNMPGIEQYIVSHLDNRKDVYKKAEEIAALEKASIVGPSVGNFLSFITTLTGSKNVLELGSSIGYSTLWFADAVGTNGKVVYTDFSEGNCQIAKSLAAEGKYTDRIEFYVGDAIKYLDTNNEVFDIIFIDLNKDLYLKALEKALPRLKKGGLIIADNTLWGGRVRWNIEDANTTTIQEYNKMVSNHPNLKTAIIPLRDGMSLSIKTGD